MRFPIEARRVEESFRGREDLFLHSHAVREAYQRTAILAISDLMIAPVEQISKVVLIWHTIANWGSVHIPVGSGVLSDHPGIMHKVRGVMPVAVRQWLRQRTTPEMVELTEQVALRLMLLWANRLVAWKLFADQQNVGAIVSEADNIAVDIDLRWSFPSYLAALAMVFEVYVIETQIESGS